MSIGGRIAAIALVTLGFTAGPRTAEVAPVAAGPQEVEVVAVMLDPVSESPVVLLHGKRDGRRLAMAIGPAEATGIAVPLRGVAPPRPLTHDLFLTLFGRLQVSVKRVVITELRDGIYYATLHLAVAGADMTLDSRPSDAIALAIRARAPVLVEDQVFDKGGSAPPRRPQV